MAASTLNHFYGPRADRLAERTRIGDTHVAAPDVFALMKLFIIKMFVLRKFALLGILPVVMATTQCNLRDHLRVP